MKKSFHFASRSLMIALISNFNGLKIIVMIVISGQAFFYSNQIANKSFLITHPSSILNRFFRLWTEKLTKRELLLLTDRHLFGWLSFETETENEHAFSLLFTRSPSTFPRIFPKAFDDVPIGKKYLVSHWNSNSCDQSMKKVIILP